MRIRTGVVALLTLALTICVSAQQTESEHNEREAVRRIRALSQQLRVRPNDASDLARYAQVSEELSRRLRSEIDHYIEAAVAPNHTSEQAQARLRWLLADHPINPEYGGPPLARIADLTAGRSLVVAYTINRGPHNDLPTIRGYRSVGSALKFVAASDSDLADYDMFSRELRSPLPGELWLLAWGQHHTFNGTKIRFRLYAFDGEAFRTVWSPGDMFDATIHFADAGFQIEHTVRDSTQQWTKVRDEYVVTASGPVSR